MKFAHYLLAAIAGITGWRQDAGETAFIAKQLEALKAQTYDIKYAAAKARSYIPVDNSIPSGAETFAYDVWDTVGVAAIIANNAKDLPSVEAFVTRFAAPIRSLGVQYGYSVQDLRAAQMAGSPLNEKRAQSAKRAIEFAIDEIAAFGNAAAGLKGFLNNTAVPLVTPVVGNWTTSTTADQMVSDLNKLVNSIVQTTKEVHKPDTLLVATSTFALLQKPSGVDNRETVLSSWLRNNPYIKNVDQWVRLDTANAAGTGPRMMAYERSSEVVELVIPQEFEQFPPQAQGLNFVIPCHARIGGVSFHYPLAAAYMDLA